MEFDNRTFERQETESPCHFVSVGSFAKTSEALMINIKEEDGFEIIALEKK